MVVMVTLVAFSLRRNLQFEEGQVSKMLTEVRRHLQCRDGNIGNLLTEEKPEVGGGSG